MIKVLTAHSPRRRLIGSDLDIALCSWWWIHRWNRGCRKETKTASHAVHSDTVSTAYRGRDKVEVAWGITPQQRMHRWNLIISQWKKLRAVKGKRLWMWWCECDGNVIYGGVKGETHGQWARHEENFMNGIPLPPVSVPVVHLHFDCSVKHKRGKRVCLCEHNYVNREPLRKCPWGETSQQAFLSWRSKKKKAIKAH